MLVLLGGVMQASADDYYIVGTLHGIDGSTDWAFPSDESHTMTKSGNIYIWTRSNVTITDGTTFEYKVSNQKGWNGTTWGKVKDNSNTPGDNQTYTVNNTGSGVYTITFKFDPNADGDDNDKVSCEVVRTDDIYLTWGNSDDPNQGTVMTNVNGVYTASQSLTAGQRVLFVPSSSWSGSGITDWSNVAYAVTTSGFYNVYVQHMEGETEKKGSYQRWYIAEDATYTFTYDSHTRAFTIDAEKTVSVNSTAGWATFSSGIEGINQGYTVSGADAFYIASTTSDKATLTSITAGAKIPTYPEGIMLKKIGGGNVTIKTTKESDVELTGNMLQGIGRYTTWDIPTNDDNYTGYTLQNGEEGLGFYPVSPDDRRMPTYKAFLRGPKISSPSRAFFLFEENETTGINALDNFTNSQLDNNAPMYNLAGQRVNKNYKGVVIVNGKKMLNK